MCIAGSWNRSKYKNHFSIPIDEQLETEIKKKPLPFYNSYKKDMIVLSYNLKYMQNLCGEKHRTLMKEIKDLRK